MGKRNETGLGDERLSLFSTILLGEIKNQEHTLTEDQLYAGQRLLERHRKRFVPCGTRAKYLEQKAVADFIGFNDELANVRVSLDRDIISDAKHFIYSALSRYTSRVSDDPGSVLDLTQMLSMWRFGPGASQGLDVTHFVDKLNSQKWTCTARALPLAQMMIDLDPHLIHIMDYNGVELNVVPGSKFSSVPKNEDTNRAIAIEPLLNMALQLSAGKYIEGALRCMGTDIRIQSQFNNKLAKTGSMTGETCTIDLKDASGRFKFDLIEQLWPIEWVELFKTIRSPEMEIPVPYGKGSLMLNMVSTMGNGFTFPMMTLTLLALLYAVQSDVDHRSLHIDYSRCGVFGDDIILPTSHFNKMCDVLSSCGLQVNYDKSFANGDFRESCGGDYYRGVNVTPFYMKSFDRDPEIYICINQLLDWSCRTGIVLRDSYHYLVSLLKGAVSYVPVWSDQFSGIRLGLLVQSGYSMFEVSSTRTSVHRSKISPRVALKAMLGGYLRGSRRYPFGFYSVRENRVRYKRVGSKLPDGFLDGTDPTLRSCDKEIWLVNSYLM